MIGVGIVKIEKYRKGVARRKRTVTFTLSVSDGAVLEDTWSAMVIVDGRLDTRSKSCQALLLVNGSKLS